MRKAHFFDLEKEWEIFVNYLKSDREPKRVAFMAPDLPVSLIPRPQEFEQLIAQLVDEKRESPIAITTTLQERRRLWQDDARYRPLPRQAGHGSFR